MKKELSLVVTLLLSTIFSFAQTSSKSFTRNNAPAKENVVMTWNKNTPEQEMKDDIKALSEYGVTIKYANVKRNTSNEITAITVSFEDKNGNKGSLNYDNKKPIATIKFYKQGDEVGFGDSEDSFDGNPFFSGFSGNEDFLKEYNFNFDSDSLSGNKFKSERLDNDIFEDSKTVTKILRDDRKPLVLENGKIIEGGDDYTAEEIEEIKKNNHIEHFNNDGIYNFSNDGSGDLAEQMKKMQQQLDKLMKRGNLKDDKSSEDKDLEDSKKELEKARQELESAKKELQKAKSTLKTQKT